GRGDDRRGAIAERELPLVLLSRPVLAFGLDIHLPLAPEAIEVVDEQASHEGLDSPVNVIDGYALLDHFVAIDSDQLLRNTRQEGGAQGANLRPFTRRGNELIDVVSQQLHTAARTVFKNKSEPPRGAHSGNGRGREAKSHGPRNGVERLVQPGFDLLELLCPRFPVAPLFHADEPKPAVAG